MPEITRTVVELVIDYSSKYDLPCVESRYRLCISTNDIEIALRKAKGVVAVGHKAALGDGAGPGQRTLAGDARERAREHGACGVGDAECRVVYQPRHAKGQRRIDRAEELALGVRGNIKSRRRDAEARAGVADRVIGIRRQRVLADRVTADVFSGGA